GGQMISYHLGFSAVQTIDPTTANRSTVMSGFLSMFGYVLILSTDQHHSMVRALAESYRIFPPGTMVRTGQWFETLMSAASQIFVIGWKIALPVFIATLLIETTVAFIARMHPQVNMTVVTAPLKTGIGIVVLCDSLAFLPRAFYELMNLVVLRPK